MKPHAAIILLVIGTLEACGGFSIKPPVFVDDRTALENQVLGEYQPLEKDLLLVTSLPGVAGNKGADKAQTAQIAVNERVSDAQARLVRILEVQQYNEDDLLTYLQKGWVGEQRDGYLHLFTDRIATESSRTREQLKRFVKQANRDRSDLVAALIVISPSLSDSDRAETERLYGKRRIDSLGEGMWFMNAKGEWTQIGPESQTEGTTAR